VNRPEREWFRRLPVLMLAVVTWFVVTVSGELIGNQANDTTVGHTIGHYLLLTAVIVAPLLLLGWLGWELVDRRRKRGPIAEEERPRPRSLPVWHPPPDLCGRRAEVGRAVDLVCDHGIVVVVGERDVGTSAVGAAVAQELIAHHGVSPDVTVRFDLRSRSASEPDDAVTVAGRVVPLFGVDEPAGEDALPKVARELIGVLRALNRTLVLDNVSYPEQVAWLVAEWSAGGPRLVVVGAPVLADLVPHSTVTVAEMSGADMRELWRLTRGTPRRRWPFGRNPEPDGDLDELLAACLGRPRWVKELAQEVNRHDNFADLLRELRHEGPASGPLERVWRTVLENRRAGLSPDAAWLLSALAVLPVTGLIEGAVAAMLGVEETPAELRELLERGLVELAGQRYRLPQEYRRAIEGTTGEQARREVAARALPRLLRFYRTYAESWVTRLESDPKRAAEWFEESEPSFRPLYAAPYDDELLPAILDDLRAIADALGRWYLRVRQPHWMLAVYQGVYDLAMRAERYDVAAHAAVRQATAYRMSGAHGVAESFGHAVTELDNAGALIERVPDKRLSNELDVREREERALVAIDRGTGLADAFTDLTKLDVASPAALINRGVLHLDRGELEDARTWFDRAEELAKVAGDQGAQAHSAELRGVVLAHSDLVEAVRLWQRAHDTYKQAGEKQGVARCLQHLGTAALADPVAAGQLLRGNPEPVDEREAARAALVRLQESISLRPRQRTPLAERYREEAIRRLVEGF
jgi:tetratricopeptide (TPR) repeat protein